MKIEFEKETCSRCGGSGRMPFANYGGICFKCNGRGTVMTRAGAAAYRRVQEVQKKVCSVPASQVKPGDRIIDSDGKTRTVTEVRVTLGKGNGGSNDPYTHEPILLNLGETVIRTKKAGFSGPAHRAVTMGWTPETIAIAAKAVSRMKGAVVTP